MRTTIQVAEKRECMEKDFTTARSDKVSIPKDYCSFPTAAEKISTVSKIYGGPMKIYKKILRKQE